VWLRGGCVLRCKGSVKSGIGFGHHSTVFDAETFALAHTSKTVLSVASSDASIRFFSDCSSAV